ncbi:MAG: TRAP transporter substrate-binding protein [Clostridiales bacterium]|nr:TRAP transporter substrate-binding protein [Clostridiales bacterium]
MKKRIVAVFLVAAMGVTLAACGSTSDSSSGTDDATSAEGETETEAEETSTGSSDATYNWQIGNVLSADQPWDMGLVKFAELLEEYSDGRITATVQSGGVLGSEIEMLEAVQMGTLDISIASTPSYSGFTDVMNYFDLPYLFTDTDTAWAVLDDWLGQDRIDALEGSGFYCLGYYDNGEYMIGSNVEILHPDQASGVRIRAHSSQLQCDTLSAVGANPLSVAWGGHLHISAAGYD